MNKKIMRNAGFSKQVDNVERGVCARCEGTVDQFKDASSRSEFKISGLCQKCQDKVFGVD